MVHQFAGSARSTLPLTFEDLGYSIEVPTSPPEEDEEFFLKEIDSALELIRDNPLAKLFNIVNILNLHGETSIERLNQRLVGAESAYRELLSITAGAEGEHPSISKEHKSIINDKKHLGSNLVLIQSNNEINQVVKNYILSEIVNNLIKFSINSLIIILTRIAHMYINTNILNEMLFSLSSYQLSFLRTMDKHIEGIPLSLFLRLKQRNSLTSSFEGFDPILVSELAIRFGINVNFKLILGKTGRLANIQVCSKEEFHEKYTLSLNLVNLLGKSASRGNTRAGIALLETGALQYISPTYYGSLGQLILLRGGEQYSQEIFSYLLNNEYPTLQTMICSLLNTTSSNIERDFLKSKLESFLLNSLELHYSLAETPDEIFSEKRFENNAINIIRVMTFLLYVMDEENKNEILRHLNDRGYLTLYLLNQLYNSITTSNNQLQFNATASNFLGKCLERLIKIYISNVETLINKLDLFNSSQAIQVLASIKILEEEKQKIL